MLVPARANVFEERLVNAARSAMKNAVAPRDVHNGPSDDRERRQLALYHCDEQIGFFRSAARRAHWLYAGSQIVTIMISASIPVILLVGEHGLPGWLTLDMSASTLAALLSAIVAIATGLAGTFHWHEQWVSYAFFAQQLISERAQFVTRAGVYGAELNGDAAIDIFVTRTEDLRLTEVVQWRKNALASAKTAERTDQPHP
jgi:hypothetical protein